MIKNKDKFMIQLSPEHLSMARVRGERVLQAERVSLQPDRWEESWSGGLQLLDQPLRQLLARFGGLSKGCHAELFYTSPGSVCRVEITNAVEAAAVAKMEGGLKQSVGRTNPSDACSIFTDEETTLVVGVADEEANLQRLYAWLNRSNVIVDRMIPRQASVVQQAVGNALAAAPDSAVLYISEYSNVIGYCEDGVPKLVRLIDIGYDKLAGVYERAMTRKTESDSGEESGEDHATTVTGVQSGEGATDGWSKMLFKHGIPVSSGKGSARHEYAEFMPAMAPVLQRISIEIKQTFRFASSLENTPSKLIVCGPGAAIPMFGVALAQNLDMHVDVIDEAKGYEPAELFGIGTCEHASACLFDLDTILLPKAAREVQIKSGLNSMLKLGAVAVAAMIGGQYLYATQKSAEVDRLLEDQSSMIERIQLDRDRRESIGLMAESIATAATLIDESMGDRVEWVGFLSSIPNDEHPLIQVSELQGRMNSARPMVNLTGTALGEADGADASEILSRYIKALREMPEVKRIEIGSTSRSLIDESNWGLQFVLAIEIATEEGKFKPYITLGQAGGGN